MATSIRFRNRSKVTILLKTKPASTVQNCKASPMPPDKNPRDHLVRDRSGGGEVFQSQEQHKGEK